MLYISFALAKIEIDWKSNFNPSDQLIYIMNTMNQRHDPLKTEEITDKLLEIKPSK